VPERDRARTTGWMQAGMLVGRATFGGLALAAEKWIGAPSVIFILVGCIWFTLAAVWLFPNSGALDAPRRPDAPPLSVTIPRALRKRTLWVGLGIALIAGAGFEAMAGLIGPFFVHHNASQEAIGLFFAVPVVLFTIAGGLVGGTLADRLGHRRLIELSIVAILVCIAAIVAGAALLHLDGWRLMALATPLYLCIGSLTASSYALFMDISDPAIGGTQFSAFMGATNLCEVWAVALAGAMIGRYGFGVAFLAVASISLLAIPLLPFSRAAPIAEKRSPGAS
jgi:predicted MFS family arabinose efflux permease